MATQQEVNRAAHLVRLLVDSKWEADVEREDESFADAATRPYYDAITLLHELASKAVK